MTRMPNYSVHQFIEDPRKKLLSIDGGGMRGVIALSMLSYLEEESGKATHQFFDMVSGTSTGAVIAAGLASGYSATDILQKAYKNILAKQFGINPLHKAFNFIKSGFNHIYDNREFVVGLRPLINNLKVSDVKYMDILITTKDVRTGTTYYITNVGKGASMFSDWPLAGVVAASAAAPIYFAPVDGNLIDGGIGSFNNTSFILATEAMQYLGEEYGYSDGNVILISLGSGYKENVIESGKAKTFNPLQWLNYTMAEQHDDANAMQTHATYLAYKNRVDTRRYNPHLKIETLLHLGLSYNEAMEHLPKIKLDTSNLDTIDFMEKVGRAYALLLNWNKPNTMAWDTHGGEPKPIINKNVNWKELLNESK